MGLDLYAGTLTRYYAQNWKTAVQQWAEQNGYQFQKLTPDGGPAAEEKPDPALVRQDIEAWRDAVVNGVMPENRRDAWPEDNEKPYYTDKPDWDAYGALLLYGASRIFDAPLPPTVKKGWQFDSHPLIQRARQEALNWSLFSGAEWWLPLEGCFYFQCDTPAGNETVISTTDTLLEDLNRLNDFQWRADADTVLSWSDTEGYPPDAAIQDGRYVPGEAAEEYRTESLAKFAFSMLYQAACFSKEHNVPILLDY